MEMEKEIKKILKALENCDFDDLDDNEDAFYDQIVFPFNEAYGEKIPYASGATKGVLIFEKLKCVIKIPFRYDSNCDGDQFIGADCDNGWDYCEAEANLYSSAEDEKVEQCFAGTEFIGCVNDYPIYKQELATIYSSSDTSTTSTHTKEDEETVESICDTSNYNCFNTYWLGDAFVYYGEKVFYQLMNFLRDYDIRDLHNGNIGYIGMKPVLVDYSGFNE